MPSIRVSDDCPLQLLVKPICSRMNCFTSRDFGRGMMISMVLSFKRFDGKLKAIIRNLKI